MINSNVRLKISPPWVTYINMLEALFGNDSEINIVPDDGGRNVDIYVENAEKAAAIGCLLPEEVFFGNVKLCITIIPANCDLDNIPDFTYRSKKELFDVVFHGNPVYSASYEVLGLFSNVLTYVVFKNKVVQFFNDNLNDIHGNVSTLYENIARELFDSAQVRLDSVFYNTDIEEKLGMPLGEWP